MAQAAGLCQALSLVVGAGHRAVLCRTTRRAAYTADASASQGHRVSKTRRRGCPNQPVHRIAARLRFRVNPKVSVWAANGDWRALDFSKNVDTKEGWSYGQAILPSRVC